eukprot:COSAG05_NODE_3448_length_2055_cov_2.713701_1_plen_123_part_00
MVVSGRLYGHAPVRRYAPSLALQYRRTPRRLLSEVLLVPKQGRAEELERLVGDELVDLDLRAVVRHGLEIVREVRSSARHKIKNLLQGRHRKYSHEEVVALRLPGCTGRLRRLSTKLPWAEF